MRTYDLDEPRRLLRAGASLLSLVLLSFPAHGQLADSEALDVETTVANALARNPSVERAQQRSLAADTGPAAVRSLPDPTLRFGLYAVPIGSIDPLAGQLRLQVGQVFPYPGTLDRRAAVAHLEAERIAAEVPLTEVAIAAATRRAYYDLWFAERAGEIHHQHLVLVRQLSSSAEQRYAAGEVPQENVLRALRELTSLYTELSAVDRDTAMARIALNTLLHRPPSAPLGVPTPPALDQLDGVHLEDLLALAELRSPLLARSRSRVAREGARIEAARQEAKPDFGVMAEWWTASDGMGGRFERYSLLGTITLPWLHDDKYVAAVDEAIASRAAAESERLATRDRVFEAVAAAWERARAAERIAELYRTTLLPQSEQSLRAARAAYETSRVEFLSLVDSERTLLLNRLGLARIEADYGRAVADMYEAVGVVYGDQLRSDGERSTPGPPTRSSAPRVDGRSR